MAYIGRSLQTGSFRQLDDISSSFNGSTTAFTMQVNSTNVSLGDVNQILLSLGGVVQKPGTDFTISGSTLTFTTAPAASTSFFAILLGSDNGGTVTPTDGSVTSSKLAYPFVINEDSEDKDFRVESNDSSHLLFVDGGNDKVLIDSGNSSTAPARTLHVRSGDANIASFEGHQGEGLVVSSGTDGQVDVIGYDDGASAYNKLILRATGDGNNIELNTDGSVNMPLQPAFHAQLATTATNIAINSYTIPALSIERFDRGGDYNTSTYEFTCPVAGLYHFEAYVRLQELDSAANYIGMRIEGSNLSIWNSLFQTAGYDRDPAYYDMGGSHFIDCDAGDQVYMRIYINGGTQQVDIGEGFFSGRLVC